MKKFLGVLLSVCLLLGLTAFPAAASGETSDRVMFVQCDTQNMTANFYFTPNPGAYWSEMGIYTEPQDGWDQDSSGKLVRLSNIVPSSLWRVGPSSMTDGDGKVNSEESVGNYDHSADQYILYWSPSLFVQTKTADAADVNFNAFGSLFYKVGENAPVPGDDAADQIEELLGELPESINAANMQSVKETLDAVSELLTANPDLEEQFAAQYQAALSAYNAVAAVVADMDEAIADLADAEMNEANEAAWKEAIKELYSIIASAEEDGVDVSGLKEEADAYAADFAKAYGYAWNTVKPGDNTGDFGILAAALAAAAGSGAIALRRKRR